METTNNFAELGELIKDEVKPKPKRKRKEVSTVFLEPKKNRVLAVKGGLKIFR